MDSIQQRLGIYVAEVREASRPNVISLIATGLKLDRVHASMLHQYNLAWRLIDKQ